jgi:hypothetical protein
LFPGVRLNVTKNGVGLGFGGKGVRFSVHSSGRRTVSAGIPGTGLYWTETHLHPSERARNTSSDDRPHTPPTDRAFDESVVLDPDHGPVLRSLSDLATLVSDNPRPYGARAATAIVGLREQLDGDRPEPTSNGAADAAAAVSGAFGDSKVWWQLRAEARVGLQPLPGFELVVQLTPESAVLLCVCHLLAAGEIGPAETLLANVPECEEVLLLAVAARMHDDDAAGAIAFGVPVVDSLATWMTGLVRAQALLDCHREDEADALLATLADAADLLSPSPEALDVAAVLRARSALTAGRVEDACYTLSDVLSADPFDQEASRLLRMAHDRLAGSGSSTEIGPYDESATLAQLQRVLNSLERELQEAQRVLLGVIEDLDDVAAEQARVLGPRQRRIATLKAKLAQLLAEISGEPDDHAMAEHCASEERALHESFDEADESDIGANRNPDPPSDAGQEGSRSFDADTDYKPADRAAPDDDQIAPDAAGLKKLYLQLVKRWHPDRGTDEQDRSRRTEVMTRINHMYEAGDRDGLLSLWEQGSLVGEDHTNSVAKLREQIAAVRAEIDATRAEIEALLASPLEKLRIAMLDASSWGRDYLRELADQLDTEISEVEQALEQLRPAEPARS